MDVEQAVGVLWFYFGYSGLFTLRDENGWSYERAERWLGAQANWALLRYYGASATCGGCAIIPLNRQNFLHFSLPPGNSAREEIV
jgi:hypothetical protein